MKINIPIQRRELVSTTEDNMQRRCVNNEHAEASTTKDTGKVVIGSDNALAERIRELGFDGVDLISINFH